MIAVKILCVAELWWVLVGIFRFTVLDKDENPFIYVGPLVVTLLVFLSVLVWGL